MTIKQLFDARDALMKIFEYKHFSAATRFYLSNIQNEVLPLIFSYSEAYNALLVKIGGPKEDGHYCFEGEQAMQFKREVDELNAQEVGARIDPTRFCIYIDELAEQEKHIPRDEWMGMSALEMGTLQGVVEIRESRKENDIAKE